MERTSHNKAGVFCSSPSFGGLEINTIRLIEWMWSYEELDIQALFLERSPLEQAASAKKIAVTSFREAGVVSRLRQLHKWVKQQGLSVLIIPHNKDLKLAALYKRYIRPRIRLVYQQHMQVGISKRDAVHTRRYKMLDVWIAPLPYLKAETLQKTRVPAERIHVIPFGIDAAPLIESNRSLQESRELLGLPQDALVIGCLGRLDPQKGQDTLIKALKILHEEWGNRAHLLLVGDATLNEGDAYAGSILTEIAESGLEGFVHLRPYQDDVSIFFRALDVFAMPSHNETYGMVTLEAMAAGVPVIGTAAGGTSEILERGQLGRLFTPQDARDFVRAFTDLTLDGNVAEKLEAAQSKVLSAYSAAGMCRSYRALLNHPSFLASNNG